MTAHRWESQDLKLKSSKAMLIPWPCDYKSSLYSSTFVKLSWLSQLVESWTIQIFALLSASSLLYVRAFGLFYHLFETCFLNSSKKPLNKVCIVYPCYRGDFDINFATNNMKVNSQVQGWSLLFSRQSLKKSEEWLECQLICSYCFNKLSRSSEKSGGLKLWEEAWL